MSSERDLELCDSFLQEQKDRRITDIRNRLPKGESAVDCEMCELPIPDGRRKAIKGVKTCAPCQELIEEMGAA